MLEIEMLYSVIWNLTVTSFAGEQTGFYYSFLQNENTEAQNS